MLNELFNDINKAKNVASIGEKRKWGNRWYMKTPRGWVLTNEEVNKITDEDFREREEELERRINEDPEFRARYQKDYGEGYTPFVHLKGNISTKEVAGIRLRNSGVYAKAKNLMALFSSSERQWVIPMLEKNIPLTDKMREVIRERGACELYLRKTKNSAPVRVMVEMDDRGHFKFTEATKREGKVDEWKPVVGSALDFGLSGPRFYSIDLVVPFKDDIEKAKRAAIGEEREWGGKIYVKTVNGWRLKGKGKKGSKDDDDKTQQPSKNEVQGEDRKAILEGYASQATDKQLESVIDKPGQTEEVKNIARQELENRGAGSKKDWDEIFDAMSRLLQVDGKDEDLKRWIDEKYESLHSSDKKESTTYSEESSSLKEESLPKSREVNDAISSLKKAIEQNGIDKTFIYQTILKSPDRSLLAPVSMDSQLQVNSALVDAGFRPVMEPFMFTEYNGERYECYDNYFMEDFEAAGEYKKKYMPKEDELSAYERKAMEDYSYGNDKAIRRLNTLKSEGNSKEIEDIYSKDYIEEIEKISSNLQSYLDKNRLKNNLILSRRMKFDGKENPFEKLQPGDTFIDPSFSSFSMQQLEEFGTDFQITLLARKGQPVNAIRSTIPEEMEFLVQKGSTFKVIEVGTGSIAVEIID